MPIGANRDGEFWHKNILPIGANRDGEFWHKNILI